MQNISKRVTYLKPLLKSFWASDFFCWKDYKKLFSLMLSMWVSIAENHLLFLGADFSAGFIHTVSQSLPHDHKTGAFVSSFWANSYTQEQGNKTKNVCGGCFVICCTSGSISDSTYSRDGSFLKVPSSPWADLVLSNTVFIQLMTVWKIQCLGAAVEILILEYVEIISACKEK